MAVDLQADVLLGEAELVEQLRVAFRCEYSVASASASSETAAEVDDLHLPAAGRTRLNLADERRSRA
ncbi:MAG: hypothetical protein ACRDZO_19300 [Egibacteraceae bacterium]